MSVLDQAGKKGVWNSMLGFVRMHSILFMYLGILLLLFSGLYYSAGTKFLPEFSAYATAFLIFYYLFYRFLRNDLSRLAGNFIHRFSTYRIVRFLGIFFFTFIIGFIIFHMFFLGHVPFLSALDTLDYYRIAFIRQSIIEHGSSTVNYLSAFMVKAFIPFFLLYFFVTRKTFFYILVPFAVFYSLALMQKSLIVSVMIPLVIYTILNRRFLQTALYSLVAVGGVFILVYTTNPNLRATPEEIRAEMIKNNPDLEMDDSKNIGVKEGLLTASGAVYKRVFITPGLMVSYWFNSIPSIYPYAYGCGYRFLAPALGCSFEDYNYSRKIYEAHYQKETKRGLKGTTTVASFMYDYANFGVYGLFLSALLLALLLVSVQAVFAFNYKWVITLNSLFIFWLSSTSLSTLLLSGGWGLTILLYLLFREPLSARVLQNSTLYIRQSKPYL